MARHETLRTIFPGSDGKPSLVIESPSTWNLPITSLMHLREQDRPTQLERHIREEQNRSFALDRGPLMRTSLLRLSPREHVLLLNIHPIVSDGWASPPFLKDLGAAYQRFSRGESPNLPPRP